MYVLFLRQKLDTKGITSAPKLAFNSSKGKMNIVQPSQDLVHMTYKHFNYLSIVRLMCKMTKFVTDLHGLFSQTDTQECLPFLPVWFWVGSQLSPPWQGRGTLRKQIQILNTALYVKYRYTLFLKLQRTDFTWIWFCFYCDYKRVTYPKGNDSNTNVVLSRISFDWFTFTVSSLVWAACVWLAFSHTTSLLFCLVIIATMQMNSGRLFQTGQR